MLVVDEHAAVKPASVERTGQECDRQIAGNFHAFFGVEHTRTIAVAQGSKRTSLVVEIRLVSVVVAVDDQSENRLRNQVDARDYLAALGFFAIEIIWLGVNWLWPAADVWLVGDVAIEDIAEWAQVSDESFGNLYGLFVDTLSMDIRPADKLREVGQLKIANLLKLRIAVLGIHRNMVESNLIGNLETLRFREF